MTAPALVMVTPTVPTTCPGTDYRATSWKGKKKRKDHLEKMHTSRWKAQQCPCKAHHLLPPKVISLSNLSTWLDSPQASVLQNGHFISFTYLPNNFLIPLAFFLESGEGGVICKLSVSFGRGGKPARSRWSADPFSVSAVRKQSFVKTYFCRTVQAHSWTLGWLLLKLLIASTLRKWGKEGYEKPKRNKMCFLFMGLTVDTPKAKPCTSWVLCIQTRQQILAEPINESNPKFTLFQGWSPRNKSVPWHRVNQESPEHRKINYLPVGNLPSYLHYLLCSPIRKFQQQTIPPTLGAGRPFCLAGGKQAFSFKLWSILFICREIPWSLHCLNCIFPLKGCTEHLWTYTLPSTWKVWSVALLFFSPLTIYKSEIVTTLFSKSWTNKAEDYLRPFTEKSKQIAISRRLHKQRCASKVPGSWRKSPCGADDACWGIASTQACWDEAAVARQPAASWQSGLQPLLPLFHIATYYDDHHVFQMDPWTCRRKPNRSHESS